MTPRLRNYTPVKINDVPTFTMIDTGADLCVANISAVNKYPALRNSKVYRSDKEYILTADGTKLPITGVIIVNVEISNQTVKCKFYLVKDLMIDFILGLDFLVENNVSLHFGSRAMSIDPRRRVVANTNFTVEPNSEVLVVARLKGKSLPDGVLGTTYGSSAIQSQGLVTAKVLCNAKQGKVYYRCANLSDNPVSIGKGQCLGKFVCLSQKDTLHRMPDKDCAATKNPTPKPNPNLSQQCHIYNDLSAQDNFKMRNVIDAEYPDIFVGEDGKLGKCDIVRHKIHLDPHQPPINQRAYRVSPKQKEILDGMLEEMQKQEIIEESTSPWSSPCMLVNKKDNKGYRFVVDYRKLNLATQLVSQNIPTTQEALDSLGSTQPVFFSSLDLHSGFFQLEIDPESRPYTAFKTHDGTFQFRRLPMGLSGSPGTFQRAMEAVLRGLNWKTVHIYLDDVIIFSRTFEEHLSHIRQVFDRFRSANLKLKPSKCFFAMPRLKYLGHIVSAEGISADPEKISSVKNYPQPTCLKQLRAFLGLTGYYRRFVKDYARIASPLYGLTQKGVPFIWSQAADDAFTKLRDALVQPPVLGYPDMEKPFRLYTDASDVSVGAVLCQVQDKVERVIAYAGKSLSGPEKNYGITEKECLALRFGVEHFDCYLRHSQFTAFVDHAALKWLFSLKNPSGRLARWISFLQSYSFTIEYKPGKAHGNADALSRRPYAETGVDADEPVEKILESTVEPKVSPPIVTVLDAQSSTGEGDRTSDSNETTADSESDETPSLDIDRVKALQRNDDFIGPMINYLESGSCPSDDKLSKEVLATCNQYFMDNGVLYHVWSRDRTRAQGRDMCHTQIVIPRALIKVVLTETHDSPQFGGHLGIARTIEKTRHRYFWPGMYTDITNWVKSCEVCCQRKRAQVPIRAQMQPMPVGAPFQRVSTDILGPLPLTDSKNRYVLVFVDYFTKYVVDSSV